MMLDAWMALTRSVTVTPARLQPGHIGDDVVLGDLAALDGDGADAVRRDSAEASGRRWRAPRAGSARPLCAVVRLRVAEDGEGGEGEAVGGDVPRWLARSAALWMSAASVELKGLEHVHVPVEEEADLGGAAAGGGAHGDEAGDAVDGVFDGLGDGDLHLLDGHDAVVDADDDAREIGLREDRRSEPEGRRRCLQW